MSSRAGNTAKRGGAAKTAELAVHKLEEMVKANIASVAVISDLERLGALQDTRIAEQEELHKELEAKYRELRRKHDDMLQIFQAKPDTAKWGELLEERNFLRGEIKALQAKRENTEKALAHVEMLETRNGELVEIASREAEKMVLERKELEVKLQNTTTDLTSAREECKRGEQKHLAAIEKSGRELEEAKAVIEKKDRELVGMATKLKEMGEKLDAVEAVAAADLKAANEEKQKSKELKARKENEEAALEKKRADELAAMVLEQKVLEFLQSQATINAEANTKKITALKKLMAPSAWGANRSVLAPPAPVLNDATNTSSSSRGNQGGNGRQSTRRPTGR